MTFESNERKITIDIFVVVKVKNIFQSLSTTTLKYIVLLLSLKYN